jgi:hypothetical protein
MASEDQTQGPGGPAAGQPSEEELRAALEEQMRQVTVDDLILQTAASLVNLTARRIAKPDEKDLEQGRRGIEAITALAPFIEGEQADQVRQALSELQMLYAREARGGGDEGGDEGEGGGAGAEQPAGTGEPQQPQPPPGPPPPGPQQPRPGGAEPPPRLWTPRGSS